MKRLAILFAASLFTLSLGVPALAEAPQPPKTEKGFDDPLFKPSVGDAGFDDPLLKPTKKKGEKTPAKTPEKELQKGSKEGAPESGIPKKK